MSVKAVLEVWGVGEYRVSSVRPLEIQCLRSAGEKKDSCLSYVYIHVFSKRREMDPYGVETLK